MMTKEQKSAIRTFELALQKLKKANIMICGMDSDILYATQKMINKLPQSNPISGEYCSVARACQSDTSEDTGIFETSGIYEDSGGW